MADLIYNIENRKLEGKVGTVHVSAYAGSGGRAGSKVKGAEDWWLANNSLATQVGGAASKGTHNYGPLPRGQYTLRLHELRNNWIRLIPAATNVMHGRAGFAIHGRGNTGSHGCLVPSDFNVVLSLCKLVKQNEEDGNPPITLEVISVGQNIGRQLVTA